MTGRDPNVVLAERAKALAMRDRSDEARETEEFATFAIDGHFLGVPMVHVTRVAVLRSLTEIPGGPAWLMGMVAVEGHLVSLLDITTFLDLGRSGVRDVTCAVLASAQGRELGLGAEQLLGIEDVPLGAIASLQGMGPLARVARLGERDLLLLDVAQLFADARLQRGQHG